MLFFVMALFNFNNSNIPEYFEFLTPLYFCSSLNIYVKGDYQEKGSRINLFPKGLVDQFISVSFASDIQYSVYN